MKMKRVLTMVLFYCVVKHSNSKVMFDKTFEQKLDSFIAKTMECRHIPGLTLSVVKGSKTWTKGYGTADFFTGQMVDNTTQFLIGSVTKSFTMVLLGVLLTEKGLDWNAKVHDIMGPKYKFVDEYRSKEITLKDMLSHRTGLARLDVGMIAGYSEIVSREQLSMKMRYLPQARPFRDVYIYSNFMYMFLGHVAEKLGGDSWENLLKDKVLSPIGMTSTRILKQPQDMLEDNVAKPYIFKDNKFQNGTLDMYKLHPFEPAGAIISTAEDIAKYIRFNLNGGTTESGRILLNPVLLKESFRSTMPTEHKLLDLTRPIFPISDTTTGYGHGLYIATYRGYRKVWHSGGWFSFISLLWLFPDINADISRKQDAAIADQYIMTEKEKIQNRVIIKSGVFGSINGLDFTTTPDYALPAILYYISDKLMGEDAWLNETTTCDFPHLWRNKSVNSKPQEEVGKIEKPSEYTGIYGHNLLPSLNISAKPGNYSVLKFQMKRLGGFLNSTQDKDRYLLEVTSPLDVTLVNTDENGNKIMLISTFQRYKDGKVRSLEVEYMYGVKIEYLKNVSMCGKQVSSQGTLLL